MSFKPQIDEILNRGRESAVAEEDDSVKLQVSLRMPKNIVEQVLRIAAEETLRSGKRVTASQIYLRAVKQYIEKGGNNG